MLHGEIKVNHHEIVWWSAVRKEKLVADGDVPRYECKVEGRNIKGYPFEYEFDVWHSFKKGALYLTSLVLAEAHSRLPTN